MRSLTFLLLVQTLSANPLLEGTWINGDTQLTFILPDRFLATTYPVTEAGRFTAEGVKLTVTTERNSSGQKVPPLTYTFAVTETSLMLENTKGKTFYRRVGKPTKK